MDNTILKNIGNTPLIEIRKINSNPNVKIFAKLEYMNPGGSIKDRPALYMIEAGEKSKLLTHDKIVLEATSGNTGIGLALVCSVKGYKLLLAMSESASIERRKILRARGADILLTSGHLGTDGAIEEVYKIARENPDKYFMTDQFNNPANWQAHFNTTAPEIWHQAKKQVNIVIATMGTTGTLIGLSKGLKSFDQSIKVVGVEPYLGHKLQGLKNMKESYTPEIYDRNLFDEKINIDDEEAFQMARLLAKKEGLFVGMSSGAAMAVALKQAACISSGNIIVIFPDSGERYLSTQLFDVKEKGDIYFFNTMTRSKESFSPIDAKKVKLYSSGPSTHKKIHLGECRRFVFTDIISRYLKFKNYQVKHVMNITDLDDKTIQAAENEGENLNTFISNQINAFYKDLNTLGINTEISYQRASEHQEDMIKIASKLFDKRIAYEKLKSLYFDISKFNDYGKLSKIDINKIRLGASVNLDKYEKDNPRDFTIFRRCSLTELKKGIYVKTQWGNIRPGWHIQSAAIAMKHLGDEFDIYASDRELIFPHHENVRAIISAITGKKIAKYWMHCERVIIKGKKVSDDNSIILKDLLDMGYNGRVVRFWLALRHYRKPLEYSKQGLENSKRSLARIDNFLNSLQNILNEQSNSEIDQILYDMKQGFTKAMDDDLKISTAMSNIFTVIKKMNQLMLENKLGRQDAVKIINTFKKINSVLNIFSFENINESEIAQLIKQRNKARKESNWELADQLRDKLNNLNIVVRDSSIEKL